jgi:hypothetical protein
MTTASSGLDAPAPGAPVPDARAGDRQPFESILFPPSRRPEAAETRDAPECFHDLNLDRIVGDVVAEWQEYDLAPFFHSGPLALDVILYRNEVMRDLDGAPVLSEVETFSGRMRAMRQRLRTAAGLDYRYERERWFLDAVREYCEGVEALAAALSSLDPRSRGMTALRRYLETYVTSPTFRELTGSVAALLRDLRSIRYRLLINGATITVLPRGDEEDYTESLDATFGRFRQDTPAPHRVSAPMPGLLNHIEAQVLDGVAGLYRDVFAALDAFAARHASFADATLTRFDREVQFFVAYRAYIDRLRHGRLQFCYATLSTASKAESATDAFDLALAAKIGARGVVTNGFALHGLERLLVVTGPNQGGKTTFARMYGQMHYLAGLGLPIPGAHARLFLADRVFTHFGREESVESLQGRLQTDLVRIRAILDQATSASVVILNEIFASTTLEDALFLSRKIMAGLSRREMLGVVVTFLDELASFDAATVSLVATVDPDDPAARTFRVERRPAEGFARALAIAAKHRVTYDQLRERLHT